MWKVGSRIISVTFVIILIVLTIVIWKMSLEGSKDYSESSGKKSHIHFTSKERKSTQKLNRPIVDTGKLRREALEILGRLEPVSNVMDIMDDAARLSAIFRQWGEADFEEAKQFLETEELAKKLLTSDEAFADELFLATLIGYSKLDPASAFEALLTFTGKDFFKIEYPNINFYPNEVAAEEIMRALFRTSEITALNMLRKMYEMKSPLIDSGACAIMSESTDAELRSRLLTELLGTHEDPFDRQLISSLAPRLAEHDPKMAWDIIIKNLERDMPFSSYDPTLAAGRDFIEKWSLREPEQALRFISEFRREGYPETGQADLLQSYITTQYLFRPELILDAFEMDFFKLDLEKSGDDWVVFLLHLVDMNFDMSWPLLDKNVPLSKDLSNIKLKQAVESSKLPEDLKERFQVKFEAKMSVKKVK